MGPRCYGCGRCITVCPPGIIRSEKYMRSPEVIRELLEKVDAVEIHTKVTPPSLPHPQLPGKSKYSGRVVYRGRAGGTDR